MEGDLIRINDWLRPLSRLYGLGTALRNVLFDIGVLKSRSFSVPVISVGNITVGGTGKTPHVEYLISLLHDKFKVAVLSRGYKRKTRGFVMAGADATAHTVGDEPYQMHCHYPDVTVAVDKDRRRGITLLTDGSTEKDIDVVLLDDAFQHRYVKPGINILLVDYHRLIIYDTLLPAGRLRESRKGKDRADIVIVTKCPRSLKPMDYRVITKAMNLYPYQHLYFTTLRYEPMRGLFADLSRTLDELTAADHVLLLTGIASPRQLLEDIRAHTPNVSPLTFADHHNFRPADADRINSSFAALPEPRMVITTEKDATRLLLLEGLSEEVRRRLYVLPVGVEFMLDEEENFNHNIISYVRKNSRNSILAKAKDDHSADNGNHSRNRSRTISFRNH